MKKKLHILLLEDNQLDARLILREIKKKNIFCETLTVNNKTAYISALKDFCPDIILSDHTLPTLTSEDALRLAVESCGSIPFIIITGTMTEDFAISIMKRGARDYIPKNKLDLLGDSIQKVMAKRDQDKLRKSYLYDLIRNETNIGEAEHIANYGSWELDVNDKKLKLSREAYKILGFAYGEETALRNRIMHLINNKTTAGQTLVLRDPVTQSASGIFKHRFRCTGNDGISRIINIEFSSKYDSAGKHVRISGILTDATYLFSLEQKLLETEKRFLALSENLVRTSILSLKANGFVLGSNTEAKNVCGYSNAEFTNFHLSLLFDDKNDCNVELYQFLSDCETDRLITTGMFQCKNKDVMRAEVVISRLTTATELSGFVLTFRPIALPVVMTAECVHF